VTRTGIFPQSFLNPIETLHPTLSTEAQRKIMFNNNRGGSSQTYSRVPRNDKANGYNFHDSDSDSDLEDDFIQNQIKDQQVSSILDISCESF